MMGKFIEISRRSQKLSCSNFSIGANSCRNNSRLANSGVRKPGNNCIFAWDRAVWSIKVDAPAKPLGIVSIKYAINPRRKIRHKLITQQLHQAHRPLVRTAADKNHRLPAKFGKGCRARVRDRGYFISPIKDRRNPVQSLNVSKRQIVKTVDSRPQSGPFATFVCLSVTLIPDADEWRRCGFHEWLPEFLDGRWSPDNI